MEVYILDSLYRRIKVVDVFQSLIWTERFTSWGDFRLDILSTTANRKLFLPGTRLAIKESYRVMVVETIEDNTDEEGRKILSITGRSLEKILDDRLVMYIAEIGPGWVNWFSFGLPKAVAIQMFQTICIDGTLNAGDIIPGVTIGSALFPTDTLPAPTDSLAYSLDPKTLYAATKELCDAYLMGFRLVRHQVTSQLYYDIYLGCDRTTAQTSLPAVIFSPGLNNLKNTKELSTISLFKNVAYVIYGDLHEIVYATDVPTDVDGFDRNVLFVKIDSMDTTVPSEITAQMIQVGKSELAKHRKLTVLDGEVANNVYEYGVDYNLGDLVELRDDEGTSSQMRVTEQIFVSDSEGDRAYPTLTIERFITPGSWLAAPPTLEWADYTSETWSILP